MSRSGDTLEMGLTMSRKLLVLGLVVVLAGAAVSTVAAQSGDEAVDGIYLSPASTSNGQAYASLDGNGELRVDVSRLNGESVTTIDSVFTISSTLDDDAAVWVEPPSSAVSLYRMDTGATITSEADAVTLSDGETMTVGMRVDTRGTTPTGGTVTVMARLPDDTTPRPVRGGGNAAPDPDTGDSGTDTGETAGPGPSTPDGGTGPTPTGPGTDAPEGTATATDTDETPNPEVGGFPWLPLLALVGAILLPLALFAYRRMKRSTIRFEVDSDSGLRVGPGAYPEAAYDGDGGVLTFAFEDTDTWVDREEATAVDFEAVATLENAADGPLTVRSVATGATPEAATVRVGSGAGTNLLAEPLTLAPGESVTLSIGLAEDFEGGTLTVRCEAD